MVGAVFGILYLGKGAVIRQIVSDFADVGYRVEYRLVDMADWRIVSLFSGADLA